MCYQLSFESILMRRYQLNENLAGLRELVSDDRNQMFCNELVIVAKENFF